MRKRSASRNRLRNDKSLVRRRRRFVRAKKPEQEQKLPDPFTVIGSVPKGRAYQWIALAVLGNKDCTARAMAQFREGGWKPVPARRHPGMPHDKKGHIIVGDQVLVEHAAKHVASAQQREQDSAREMRGHAQAAQRGEGRFTVHFIDPEVSHYRIPKITDEQRAAWDAEIKSYGDARYAVINVTLGLVLTDGERKTAEALSISPSEYAFRKFQMFADVLQLQNDHAKTPGHIKIFDHVCLKTEKFT